MSTIAAPAPGSATPAGGAAMLGPDSKTTTSVQIVLGNMVPSWMRPKSASCRRQDFDHSHKHGSEFQRWLGAAMAVRRECTESE
jgi:hypothetical protein